MFFKREFRYGFNINNHDFAVSRKSYEDKEKHNCCNYDISSALDLSVFKCNSGNNDAHAIITVSLHEAKAYTSANILTFCMKFLLKE